MELHKNGPCSLCCDAGNDFDYCRACGFTGLDVKVSMVIEEETKLGRAIKAARGGDAPSRFKGYA